jgi:hypothetical protein
MLGLTFSSTTISSLSVGVSNTTIVGSETITQADVDAGRYQTQL